MSDLPVKQLKGKTPLEVSKTTNMDFLAQNGLCGWVYNVPEGMAPGSDVAAMSIFGYDPKKNYTGRGPLEAASLGIELKKEDVAFRCNLVTVKNGLMDSFTAGHISTEEADKILKTLNKKIGDNGVKFYTGLSYRHLLVVSKEIGSFIEQLNKVSCIPPHDITGKAVEKKFPSGASSGFVRSLMKESIMHLLEHPVNINRIKKGKKPATMIWLWGQGKRPGIESFRKKFKKSAAVITAVHLLKGLGSILGMEVVNVPGATGFLDTNYEGKAKAALRMIKKHDVVFVHVEAPDECGHMGDVKGKIRAIEDFDSKIVGPILKYVIDNNHEAKILVLPDHPTPIKLMTHSDDPVPFVIYNSKKTIESDIKGFNEKELRKAKLNIKTGKEMLKKLFN